MYWGNSRLRAAFDGLLHGSGQCEILVRARGRVVYVPLTRARQLLAVFLVAAAGAWIGHASFSYFELHRVIEGKNRDIALAGEENRQLSAKMSEMRGQFSDVAGTLDRNHRDLANLLKQNNLLKGELGDVGQKLRTTEGNLAESRNRRALLDQQLAKLNADMAQVEERNQHLADNLNVTRGKLNDTIAERSRVDTERRSLELRVAGLEQRLGQLRNAQENLLNRVTAQAATDLKTAEKVIARVGLNIDKLLRRADSNFAQGGPFIPAGSEGAEGFADGVAIFDRHMERLADVRALLRRLPLAKPVRQIRIASRFGRRRDPINRKWARHEGLDLSGPLRTPILAPAAGKVIFAGWKGRYGRLITIDHGLGIRTRFGHLRQIHVKRGQTVETGEMIGLLGNSGRSTGAHLHYEILVDGKPVDPLKFLKAGEDVFKG